MPEVFTRDGVPDWDRFALCLDAAVFDVQSFAFRFSEPYRVALSTSGNEKHRR
jgi:hypothetical protein